ncbi:response regulator [Phormidium sp. CCY1219]|uniref:response regulator n=1 Tax=Phormidium sp. CCY1219 TaxID=2886104 RepID=UPI002D1E96CC|nr:response regulator [Phormidium sp. CCY1219]MEB3827106.1 response regulator [Phormidium sp. CCY1219]
MNQFDPEDFLILVVDDTISNLKVIGYLLEKVGYDTTFATNGRQAIERVRTAKPDLILLDLMMPEMDGLEVCDRLKADPNTREIPIIFITANQETDNLVEAFKKGAADYITKPFRPEEALARIETQLTNQQLKKELTRQNEHLQREIETRTVAEARLRLLERAIASSSNGIVITDFQQPDNPIIYVNSGFERITGYSASEIMGRNCRFLQGQKSPINRGALVQLRQAIHAGTNCQVVLQNFRKNGRMFWNQLSISPVREADGTVNHFVGVITDITERLAFEEALKNSQSSLAQAQKIAHLGNWEFDIVTQEISGSVEIFRILGFDPKAGKIDYHQLLKVFHNEDAEIFENAVNRAINEGISYEIESRIWRNPGELRYLEIRGEAVFDEGGNITRLFGTVLDISERKKAEFALKEAANAAQAANQAKSTFLANMSHELRTPLNAILGFSELMMGGENLAEEHQENLRIICRSGEHLLTLINDILDMAKIEAGRITLNESNFDLYQMLKDLEGMFRLKAEKKGLYFAIECDPKVPQYIRTDEVKLRQVSLNLLSNAFKFTQRGSVTMRVNLGREETKPREGESERNREGGDGVIESPRSPDRTSSVTIHFEVEDTGCGIPLEELESIFEAFVQTKTGKKSAEGTGLGLPIARKFVALMGGEMRVSSPVSQGTKFHFTIRAQPVDRSDAIQADRRQAIALEANQPTYRLLIVDDKWDNRRLLVKLLGPFGFEIREAKDGKEAIAVWEEFQPHLIFMDMRMPVMDGFKATQQIKSTTKGKNTAIVAVTASSLNQDRTLVLQVGCEDFIRKPFREADIFEILTRYLGVRFRYASPIRAQPDGFSQCNHQLTPHALAQVPAEYLATLERATARSDMESIDRTIQEIRHCDRAMGDLLRGLADKFAYEEMLAIIQQAKVL